MPILPLCVLLFTACMAAPVESAAVEASTPQDSISPVVVLELFTSQGCSSCPPADELLGELAAARSSTEGKIIALSFHVDYWNRLGWSDPYSQEIFSNRQYEYSGKLPSRVYTPQIVINGQEDVVGSRKSDVRTRLRERLTAAPHPINFHLELKEQDADGWTIDFQTSGSLNEKPQLLNVALVQREVRNDVPRGENRGRQLSHYNVVLDFKQYSLDPAGSGRLKLDRPADTAEYALIVYAQDNNSWAILGAADLDLP